MRYFDTSFLAPLLREEKTSSRIGRFRRYLDNYETGLRAGDALHLAIAGNHRAKAIYSLDKTMIKAGKILGLPVSAGIRAD
jgi:hypothetical protein